MPSYVGGAENLLTDLESCTDDAAIAILMDSQSAYVAAMRKYSSITNHLEGIGLSDEQASRWDAAARKIITLSGAVTSLAGLRLSPLVH